MCYGVIRDIIVKFLAKHKADLYDVHFQCDSDCVYFAKDSGLLHTAPGMVHGYADGVVWANNKGKEPDGTMVMDLTQELEEEMLKKCAK